MYPLSHMSGPDEPITVWGHSFHWTSKHKTAPEIAHLLYSYDKLATDALDRLDEISPPTSKSWRCPHGAGDGQRDLHVLLQKYADSDEVLGQLWEEVSTVPEWVDWEQIERGQRVVYQYSVQILLGVSKRHPEGVILADHFLALVQVSVGRNGCISCCRNSLQDGRVWSSSY